MRSIISRSVFVLVFAALLQAFAPQAVQAQTGPNILFPVAYIENRLHGPLEILDAKQARPSVEGDRSARVVLAGPDGEPGMEVLWKPVSPPGDGFNNEPRYALATYRLQSLFLDECEYVVPPVVMRALTRDEYRSLRNEAPATILTTDSVLFLLSYWLSEVSPNDPWDAARFATDPRYARHWGNLNILTHLIDHKDANYGNLLVSTHPDDPRLFAVDNDVAFDSRISDRGDTWSPLLVDRLPQKTIDRLRSITRDDLEQALGVVAEFHLEDGVLTPVATFGKNLANTRGVRSRRGRIQFGLTRAEIRQVQRRIDDLLEAVDEGRIGTFEDSAEALGLACLAVARQ
ncbi:hypothetical protein [Wenzhouxiangella sp. XN24]|uniref:hypothetical protein n=1 Tax=Wenzhouxiangella sp. XN24 TaxID=2713569 RepID=UPI0013EE1D7B|nr:hypothetical protein [Wenzhouxiangella sp. XN24]NGX15812.1 hypothetical protein [Wenzhouxiangella sp. XN24]